MAAILKNINWYPGFTKFLRWTGKWKMRLSGNTVITEKEMELMVDLSKWYPDWR